MPSIFICYRREGAGYAARFIYERLENEFSPQIKIFIDVDKIDMYKNGVRDKLKERIRNADVFLCLIDKDWLTCKNEKGIRRLDDPDDYVRLEITTAIEGKTCIAPILLQNVKLPTNDQLPQGLISLPDKQAFKVSCEEEFDNDMAKLIKCIRVEIAKHSMPPDSPLEFVDIPAGTFQMGSPPNEEGRFDNEELHEVPIKAFSITKYPVTFDQYDFFAEKTGCHKPDDNGWNRGRRPVINISAREALKYAAWLSEEQGQRIRLPTEAEWEYAARAGTVTPFHFGNIIDTKQANFGNQDGKTVEVGQLDPNDWGLHDIHGNVSEWTCSKYDGNYGGAELICAKRMEYLTIRGGSWQSERRFLRCAVRTDQYFRNQKDYLGFRLVLDQD